jgi:histidinol dehydrogenase
MTPEQRDALCRRGLDDIFEPTLRTSIGALIEDVRVRGDEAVCDALAKFDGIRLTPDQLRVSAEEIATASIDPAVENAIIDAISHLRAFNDQILERNSDWQIEIENGLTAGEKITPISSVGLFVPSGKASYPSVAYQLGVPAVVAGVPSSHSLFPLSLAAMAKSTPLFSWCAAYWASRTSSA